MTTDFVAQLKNISATALDDLQRKTTYDELLQWLSAYLGAPNMGFGGQFSMPLGKINDELASEVIQVARSLHAAGNAKSIASMENEWFHVPTGKMYRFCVEGTEELLPEAKLTKDVLVAYCLKAKQLI